MSILEIIGLISFALAIIFLIILINYTDGKGVKKFICIMFITVSLVSSIVCVAISARQKEKTKGVEYKLEKYNVSYKYIVEEDKTDTILVIKRK